MAATAEETRRWAWTPRVPLTAAERRVDFPLHNRHIVERRLAVERYATPAARRLAFLVAEHGLPTTLAQKDLEARLYVSLTRSVEFGYQQVRRELRDPVRPAIRAAVILPDVGKRGRTVLQGLAGIHGLVRSRAAAVARDVADAATAAAHGTSLKPGSTAVTVRLAVNDAVRRTLHNDVLQLVGEAINLGRAAAAVEVLQERGGASQVLAAAAQTVPEFAMRSEQLDDRTCEGCDAAHGAIVQVGSSEFYDDMPPAGCFGGGRCRGIYVFGEGSEFAAPAPTPGEPPPTWKDGETRFSLQPNIPPEWQRWQQGLTQAQRDALNAYTGGRYQPINGVLRGEREADAETLSQIADIRAAIASAPDYAEPVTVWRGITNTNRSGIPTMDDAARVALQDAERQFPVGSELTLDGFQSTSFWTDPALDASAVADRPGVVLEIESRSGAYLGETLTKYDDEAELLLRDGAHYRVISVTKEYFEKGDYGERFERIVVRLRQL